MATRPLTHYVVVRRDLTVGQASAQIVHAAGESIAAYASSSEKERQPLRSSGSGSERLEVGGSSPSSRAISGSGVAERASAAGAIPAFRTILPPDTVAVVLGVRNESRLLAVTRRLDADGVPYVLIREPDMQDAATAIGVLPCYREEAARALKDCQWYLEPD